jgi:HEAT repeat protein
VATAADITQEGERRRAGLDDHREVAHEPVALACALAVAAWLALTLVTVVGRAAHDLRRAVPASAGRRRTVRALARRATRHRTELGRWRRASALVELARRGASPARLPLYRAALRDGDPVVRAAAVRGLGYLAAHNAWARGLLVDALVNEHAPRSRVAAELEGVECGELLEPLLSDDLPVVRYWAAMLLGAYPDVGSDRLAELVGDPDPSVRRAAIESLAHRGDDGALARVVGRLGDEVMYVRAHACRAAARLGGGTTAPLLAPLLGDEAWWVRSAAKDALRALGVDVAPVLITVLDSPDRFARNGAAEVLQDLGVVDHLLLTEPDSALLARIVSAGEAGLLDAAQIRLDVGSNTEAEPGATSSAPTGGEAAAA